MGETEVQKAVNKEKLSISRIPSWAKEVIVGRAEEEHCGDYGACIAQMVRESNEYNCLKRKFFNSEFGVSLVKEDKHDEKKKADDIVAANGKVIKRRNT